MGESRAPSFESSPSRRGEPNVDGRSPGPIKARGFELSTGSPRLDTMSAILRKLERGGFKTEKQITNAELQMIILATTTLQSPGTRRSRKTMDALAELLDSRDTRERSLGSSLLHRFQAAARLIAVATEN